MSEEKKLSERVRQCDGIVRRVLNEDMYAQEVELLEQDYVADEIAALEKRLALADSDADVMKANWHAACNQLDGLEKRLAEAETPLTEKKCAHKNRECTYESDDGEFERWRCKDCGESWGVEIAQ